MSTLQGFPYFEVEFNKKGRVHDADQVTALLDHVSAQAVSDLFVVSHGWNNDMAEARRLYDSLFGHIRTQDSAGANTLAGRDAAVMGVFWPSKKFADKDLIPSGAASLGGDISDTDLIDSLEELKGVFDADGADAALDEAKGLVSKLDRKAAQRDFVDRLRVCLGDASEYDDESSAEIPSGFFNATGDELLDDLAKPPPLSVSGGGGAAGMDAGGAAGLGSFFGSIKAGARNLLNFITYYQMKKRAGIVGANGVNEVIRQVRDKKADVKIHLIGHSFGGRLVAAVARGPDGEPPLVMQSMALLQAAFSHNGFAQDFDGSHDGFFRRVVEDKRVAGPLLVTHTVNDKAVGVAYPIASRIAGQNAAFLGDANDPFGGIGRNGAQKTPEAEAGTLLAPGGDYAFESKVYNLKADDHVSNHSDVANAAVANAIVQAVAIT